MHIEKKALYNLLRMNWLLDPSLPVEPWQVEDYRLLAGSTLFSRLARFDIALDEETFIKMTDNFETPESFVETLFEGRTFSPKEQDEIYLAIFELWRRFLTEKPCISIFSDDLDREIALYDRGDLSAYEKLQDHLAELEMILDSHVDEGKSPAAVFQTFCTSTANDMETFLYDFIADEIDAGHFLYAAELVESFAPYVSDPKWFEFLRLRISASQDQNIEENFTALFKKALRMGDLEFNLEVLDFMSEWGQEGDFVELVKKTIPLIRREEEFQDLVEICTEYYRRLDRDQKEAALEKLLSERLNIAPLEPFNPKDPHVKELLNLVR